jgi:hypothetical protein
MVRIALLGLSAVVIMPLALPSEVQAVYHPRLGRFLQRDPAGYADGMGPYEYVRSAPIRYVDPRGLFSIQNVGTSPDFNNLDAYWAVAVFPSGGEVEALSRAGGGHLKEKIHIQFKAKDLRTGNAKGKENVLEAQRPLLFYPPIGTEGGSLKIVGNAGPIQMSKPGKPSEKGRVAYKYIVPINNSVRADTCGEFIARVDVELWTGDAPFGMDPREAEADEKTFSRTEQMLGANEVQHNVGSRAPAVLEDTFKPPRGSRKLAQGWAKATIQWCKNKAVKLESEGSKNFNDNAGQAGPSRWKRKIGEHSQAW